VIVLGETKLAEKKAEIGYFDIDFCAAPENIQAK
jgi:hypothetical protein